MKDDKVKFTEKNNMKARKMILDSPLEVKAIKQFRGHDGDGYNCNIYWDGKKVGYANDFADGGGGEAIRLMTLKPGEFAYFGWDLEADIIVDASATVAGALEAYFFVRTTSV